MKNKLPYVLGFFISFSIDSFGNEPEDNCKTPANSHTNVITQNYNEKKSSTNIIQNAQLSRKQKIEPLLSYYDIKYGLGREVAVDRSILDDIKTKFHIMYSEYKADQIGMMLDKDLRDIMIFFSSQPEKRSQKINAKHEREIQFVLNLVHWMNEKKDRWSAKKSYPKKALPLEKDDILKRYQLYDKFYSGLKYFSVAKSKLPIIWSPNKREHIIDGAIIQDQVNNYSKNSDINSSKKFIVGGITQFANNILLQDEFNSRENVWDYVDRKMNQYKELCITRGLTPSPNRTIDLDAPIVEKTTDNIVVEQLLEQLKTLTAEKNDLSVKFNLLSIEKTTLVSQLSEKDKELKKLTKQLENSKNSNQALTEKLESTNWKTPLMLGATLAIGGTAGYFYSQYSNK